MNYTDPGVCRRVALLSLLNMYTISKEKNYTFPVQRTRLRVTHLRKLMHPVSLPPDSVDDFLQHLNNAAYPLGVQFARYSDAEVFVFVHAWLNTIHRSSVTRVEDLLQFSIPELEHRLEEAIKAVPTTSVPTTPEESDE